MLSTAAASTASFYCAEVVGVKSAAMIAVILIPIAPIAGAINRIVREIRANLFLIVVGF